MNESSISQLITPISCSNSHGRKRTQMQCRECDECHRNDCGSCVKCLKKKKIGGDGSCKVDCNHRRCKNLQDRFVQKKRGSGRSFASKTNEDDIAGGISDIRSNSTADETTGFMNHDTRNLSSFFDFDNQSYKKIEEAPFLNTTAKPPQEKLVGTHSPIPLKSFTTAINHTCFEDATTSSNEIRKKSRMLLYGKCNPRYNIEECAGCFGKRTKELEDEPIIICDGCEREFHLDCCLPPVVEVPAGIYYCIDCSEKGSTACLEKYFEEHIEKRSEYASSFDFVKALLEEMIIEEGGEICCIPQSELARLSKIHHDALILSERYLSGSKLPPQGIIQSSELEIDGKKIRRELGPDFLLGKSLRLYCPIGNQYHSGRIVSWRPVSHCDKFWASNVADAEFLVRFSSGKDYRKTTHRQWLILEEHALAIGTTLIWGMNFPRKGLLGWNPAQTWLRTSLELLPVRTELARDQNQIYHVTDTVCPDHNSWALATFWGEDLHVLMELRDEAVDYFSVPFADARFQRHLTMVTTDAQLDVYMGLAQIEWEEQKYVREWNKLPIKDPMHHSIIRLEDETSLEPSLKIKSDPLLCKSIQIDLDRLQLLYKISSSPTRDIGSSLVCELVKLSPHTLKQFEEQKN